MDAYVIGGGPSLTDFDWSLLAGCNTIGCNAAYTLGPGVCKICIFGDRGFFNAHREGLAKFSGWVVTNEPHLLHVEEPWLKVMKRLKRGLGTEALGWNHNTGASAINLALVLGVKRVFLLGFDMEMKDGRPNWHTLYSGKPRPAVYERYLGNFQYVLRDLERWFPDRQVINLTPGTRLQAFPIEDLQTHFQREVVGASHG